MRCSIQLLSLFWVRSGIYSFGLVILFVFFGLSPEHALAIEYEAINGLICPESIKNARQDDDFLNIQQFGVGSNTVSGFLFGQDLIEIKHTFDGYGSYTFAAGYLVQNDKSGLILEMICSYLGVDDKSYSVRFTFNEHFAFKPKGATESQEKYLPCSPYTDEDSGDIVLCQLDPDDTRDYIFDAFRMKYRGGGSQAQDLFFQNLDLLGMRALEELPLFGTFFTVFNRINEGRRIYQHFYQDGGWHNQGERESFQFTQSELDSFNILGLSPEASWEEVKKQYRKLVLLWHPDKGGAPERFIALQNAYNELRSHFGKK